MKNEINDNKENQDRLNEMVESYERIIKEERNKVVFHKNMHSEIETDIIVAKD